MLSLSFSRFLNFSLRGLDLRVWICELLPIPLMFGASHALQCRCPARERADRFDAIVRQLRAGLGTTARSARRCPARSAPRPIDSAPRAGQKSLPPNRDLRRKDCGGQVAAPTKGL